MTVNELENTVARYQRALVRGEPIHVEELEYLRELIEEREKALFDEREELQARLECKGWMQ